MAEIKIFVENGRMFFRENVDRSGVMLSIDIGSKQALRQTINSLTNHGDEVIATGEMNRYEDQTAQPIAIFVDEFDCDNFVALKGGNIRKLIQDSTVDGFRFVAAGDT